MRFFFFVFVCATLFAKETVDEYLTSERNTLALLEDVINTENGKLVQIDHDIYIDGSSPLSLYRYYDAGHQFRGNFGYGVGLSLPLLLIYDVEEGELRAQEREGSFLICSMKSTSDGHFFGKVRTKQLKQGYSNCCEALLRGEPSLLAMTLKGSQNLMFVTLGNGTVRVYNMYGNHGTKFYYYRLMREDFPNGNKRHYAYLSGYQDKLERIWTTNGDQTLVLSWVNFNHGDDCVTIEASNGQSIKYSKEIQSAKRTSVFGDDKFYDELLIKTHADHLVDTQYEYLRHAKHGDDLFCMKKVLRPNGRFLEVDYGEYKYGARQVKKLTWGGKKHYTFHYSGHHTYVKDALGYEKVYQFVHGRLQRLTEKHRVLGYTWSDYGNLLSQTLLTPSGKLVREKQYAYNDTGYVTKASLKGVIREPNVYDSYVVNYAYSNDHFHLLLNEVHNNHIATSYTYVPGTNLRATKRVSVKGKTYEREFCYYDKNGILTSRTLPNTRNILPRPTSQVSSSLAQQVRAAESSMAKTGVYASKGEATKSLNLDALSKAGHVMDREGLTRAGRALDKHGNRLNSPFPRATGNPLNKNMQGQWHLDDILTNPETRIIELNNGSMRFYSPDGRGIQYRADGSLQGFLNY